MQHSCVEVGKIIPDDNRRTGCLNKVVRVNTFELGKKKVSSGIKLAGK